MRVVLGRSCLGHRDPIKYSISNGALIVASPAIAAKIQNDEDRALILRKLLDQRYRNELHGCQIVLRWDNDSEEKSRFETVQN